METGPILGILSIPRTHSNHFMGGQSEAFAEIIATAKKMRCTAYVFGPFEIDWSRQAVLGYRFNPLLQPNPWETQLFPLPTVIYNRIPNRTLENRDDIVEVLAKLTKKFGARLFNPCFLDKWKTHTILFNNTVTRTYLPETALLDSVSVITAMLKKHGAVYLKPTANSLGNEIIKVTKKGTGGFHFIHQNLNQDNLEGVVSSILELPGLQSLLSTPPSYLVQQAIDLAKINGRPFDLRVLLQKNQRGLWKTTGMAARAAGDGSITTHVLYGGSRVSALKAIKQAAQNNDFSIPLVMDNLRILHSSVPKTIEKAVGHSFGELEADVGIDNRGNVLLFEANSKPFRFDEKNIREKSLVRLIQYTQYLDSRKYGKPAL